MRMQSLLYRGIDRAKHYLQVLHWDTRQELSPEAARLTYNTLYGDGYGDNIAAEMSRAVKEAEAKRRLEDAQ